MTGNHRLKKTLHAFSWKSFLTQASCSSSAYTSPVVEQDWNLPLPGLPVVNRAQTREAWDKEAWEKQVLHHTLLKMLYKASFITWLRLSFSGPFPQIISPSIFLSAFPFQINGLWF